MFQWQNHYSFHNPLHSSDTNSVCKLCALLNNDNERAETTVYKNIVKWFNDRKDWNLWNTKTKNVTKLYSNQSEKRKSTRKLANNKHLINSDSNVNKNDGDSNIILKKTTFINSTPMSCNKNMSEEDTIDRNNFQTMLEDDDNDEGEIISIDENSLNINDVVTVSK